MHINCSVKQGDWIWPKQRTCKYTFNNGTDCTNNIGGKTLTVSGSLVHIYGDTKSACAVLMRHVALLATPARHNKSLMWINVNKNANCKNGLKG